MDKASYRKRRKRTRQRVWQLVDLLMEAGNLADAKRNAKQHGMNVTSALWEQAVALYMEERKIANETGTFRSDAGARARVVDFPENVSGEVSTAYSRLRRAF
jgi:hypothetical protein